MATPGTKKSKARPNIVIDIPKLSAETRVGDLTVRQFVELLVQVSAQLRAQAIPPQREHLVAVLDLIRSINGSQSFDDPDLSKHIRSLQERALADVKRVINKVSTKPTTGKAVR